MSRPVTAGFGFSLVSQGALPVGWRWMALKRCCRAIQRGLTPVYADRGVPLVNQACVQWQGIRWTAVKHHRPQQVPDRAWLRTGDVLVNSTGSGTLGRAAVLDLRDAPLGERYLADSHITILRPGDLLDGRFLKYCLETPSYRRYLASVLATGATKQHELSREGLCQLPIPLPPLPEQRALADRLDQLTLALDRVIERKQELQQALEERFWVRAETLLVGGRERWSQQLGALPPGWRAVPLMYLVDRERPITYGIVQPGPVVTDGVPLIKAGHVDAHGVRPDGRSRTSKAVAAQFPRGRLQAGDLVMAIRGSVGAVGEVPAALDGAYMTQDVARIAPGPGMDPRWLLAALRSRVAQRQVELCLLGATVLGLNLRDLRRIVLPVPPAAEQRRIGGHLAEMQAALAALSEKTQESRGRLGEYRMALLSAAVRGRLDRMTPIPASVLDAVAAG